MSMRLSPDEADAKLKCRAGARSRQELVEMAMLETSSLLYKTNG